MNAPGFETASAWNSFKVMVSEFATIDPRQALLVPIPCSENDSSASGESDKYQEHVQAFDEVFASVGLPIKSEYCSHCKPSFQLVCSVLQSRCSSSWQVV